MLSPMFTPINQILEGGRVKCVKFWQDCEKSQINVLKE